MGLGPTYFEKLPWLEGTLKAGDRQGKSPLMMEASGMLHSFYITILEMSYYSPVFHPP